MVAASNSPPHLCPLDSSQPIRPGPDGSRDFGAGRGIFSRAIQAASASALVLGLLNGFLPCPITMYFLAFSAGTGSVLQGMATMAAMGAGTVGGLLVLGLSGQALRSRWRTWGSRAVGSMMLLMGLCMLLQKAGVIRVPLTIFDCRLPI